MSLSLADQLLIRSIFYLNSSQKTAPESSSKFSWEGEKTGTTWTKFYYIHDDQGKVQWIFPAHAPYPAFLSLQNSAYPLTGFQKFRYQSFFNLGWKNQLADGAFYVKHEESFPLFELLHSVPHESYAILTNTTGRYRKSVVALHRGKYPTHYIKLAHSPLATEVVYNEVYALQILSQRRLQRVVHPFLSHTDGDHAIIISSVKPPKGIFSPTLTPIHFRAIQDIYKKFSHFRLIQDLPYVNSLDTYLEEIEKSIDHYNKLEEPELAQKIAQLLQIYRRLDQQISFNEEVWVSLSHGDFLPWNMYISDKRIYLFDWEYMQESLPLLYDLFYFLYHSHLIYDKGNVQKVQRVVENFFQDPLLQEIIETYSIDPFFYHRLYLMIDIPFILFRELKQEHPPSIKELERLFEFWIEILQREDRT